MVLQYWKNTDIVDSEPHLLQLERLRRELKRRGRKLSELKDCDDRQTIDRNVEYSPACACRYSHRGTNRWKEQCPYCLGTGANLDVLRLSGLSMHEQALLFLGEYDEYIPWDRQSV